jgi:hypothetical protein
MHKRAPKKRQDFVQMILIPSSASSLFDCDAMMDLWCTSLTRDDRWDHPSATDLTAFCPRMGSRRIMPELRSKHSCRLCHS